jgi:CPA1 family monovalent cation:H+ antiporter
MSARAAFELAAVLFALTAAVSYLNYRLLRLPQSIALVAVALVASLAMIGLDRLVPGLGLRHMLGAMVGRVDLAGVLLDGALSFLLFAGALHMDLSDLLSRKWTILILATAGVALSTALIGLGMYAIFGLLGLAVPLMYCLAFGALISPTDPVAVLDLFRGVSVPHNLQVVVAGESLFNDGMSVVLFGVLAGAASTGGNAGIDPLEIFLEFLREGGGAIALGLATGYVAFLAIRGIDDYTLELMITIALVTTTYAAAHRIGVSGPVAVVVAGLIIGTHGARYAMSERSRGALRRFWSFTDQVLNSLLFLLIGFEVVTVEFSTGALIAAALAIPLALAVRLISITVPSLPLHLSAPRKGAALATLTWGGLRGGISVALALSLPASGAKQLLVTACYAVVVFTILVQGLTMRPLVRRLFAGEDSR